VSDYLHYRSAQYFEGRLQSHDKVLSVRQCARGSLYRIYEIKRKQGDIVLAYLVEIYMLGVTDYYGIRDEHPEVTSIVVASRWGHYTEDAKSASKSERIGLFNMYEFFSSLF